MSEGWIGSKQELNLEIAKLKWGKNEIKGPILGQSRGGNIE